jgi:hypothetical protein
MVDRLICFGVKPQCGAHDQLFNASDSGGFVDVERPP